MELETDPVGDKGKSSGSDDDKRCEKETATVR